MDKIFIKITDFLKKWIELSLYFLCFGVVVQLLIDETILGWDPIGNIQDAGSSFIGIIAVILLYLLFVKKRS